MLQDGQYLKNYTLLQIILQFWKGKMGNIHQFFVTDVLLSYVSDKGTFLQCLCHRDIVVKYTVQASHDVLLNTLYKNNYLHAVIYIGN